MKFAGLMVAMVVCISCSGTSPIAFAQTQSQMNEGGCDSYKKADLELNQVYGQIVKLHHSDTAFLQAFRAAQRAWIVFRDAEVKAKFPEPSPQTFYGSSYPMCACAVREQLTKQRTEQLRQTWLGNTAEGDVCAGSSMKPK